jgi:GT2 family glycosyltransferase
LGWLVERTPAQLHESDVESEVDSFRNAEYIDHVSGPKLSILIVNWNTRDRVLRCLESVAAATNGIPSEVIVVDNGSVDGSSRALASKTGIILLENGSNLGFAAAVNQAYRRSSGELVLLLNSDVVLHNQDLRSMIVFLDDHHPIAGVAPLYVFPDGSPQPFHFRFPTFSVTLANCSTIARRFVPGITRRLREYQMLDDDFSHARPVPQPSASCLLLRRSALPENHIFDERYPIFYNDVQFARSLAAGGLELWVTPDATVVHEGGASTRMLGVSGKRQYLGSTIRMLTETESPSRVWLFRVVVFAQHVPLWILARPNTIGVGQLWNALSGDVGSLPTEPTMSAERR